MDAPFSSIDQAERLIAAFAAEFKEGKAISWALALLETNTCIGTCSVMIGAGPQVEIGYDLAKACWGQGFISEALRTIMAYGFATLGCEKIVADTLAHNLRSINLLNRLSFQLDDVRAGSHFFSLQQKE